MKFKRSSFMPASGLLLIVAGVLQGCPTGASLDNAEEHLAYKPEIDTCDAEPLFEEECSGSICHSSKADGTVAGGVNLDPPGVGARLLNQPATYPKLEGDGCPEVPELLVNSAEPEKSLLMLKLRDEQTCGDGMPHPYRTSKLSPSEMACVEAWMAELIENGAEGTGTGGQSGTGGDSGAGGSSSGGSDGSGGAANAVTIEVEAECAFSMGCPTGVTGSYMEAGTGPMTEAANGGTVVGYINPGVTFTYAGIATNGHQCLEVVYSKGNVTGESLTVYLTDATGTPLGAVNPIPATGALDDWSMFDTLNVPLSQALTGVVTLHLVAGGAAAALNFDSFSLLVGGCP